MEMQVSLGCDRCVRSQRALRQGLTLHQQCVRRMLLLWTTAACPHECVPACRGVRPALTHASIDQRARSTLIRALTLQCSKTWMPAVALQAVSQSAMRVGRRGPSLAAPHTPRSGKAVTPSVKSALTSPRWVTSLHSVHHQVCHDS